MSDPADPSLLDQTTIHLRKARVAGREGARSLEWLVDRFTPALVEQARYQMGRRLRTDVDPEDVAMDVWARTLPRLPDLEPRNGRLTPVLMKFLAVVLRNRVQELLEKHVRGKPVRLAASSADDTDPIDGLADTTVGVLRRVMRSEGIAEVRAAVSDLGEDDRAVVVLRGIEQNSYEEVASLLGCTEAAARQRYSRAMRRLKDAIPRSVFAELESDVP